MKQLDTEIEQEFRRVGSSTQDTAAPRPPTIWLLLDALTGEDAIDCVDSGRMEQVIATGTLLLACILLSKNAIFACTARPASKKQNYSLQSRWPHYEIDVATVTAII